MGFVFVFLIYLHVINGILRLFFLAFLIRKVYIFMGLVSRYKYKIPINREI